MPFSLKPPPMPDPALVPFVDPATGKINAVWLEWLIKQIAWEVKIGAAIP